MAKKEFGDALRRKPKKSKPPIDVKAAESVSQQQTVAVPEEKEVELPVKRTSYNWPLPVYEAMRRHCFDQRISMRDYLMELVKKDLGL
ncbi:MAG: hypothetical protein AAFV95_17835 [Bacteroidota bacterium]